MKIGITHAATSAAAEAGSLAAVKTIDEWLLTEFADEIENHSGTTWEKLASLDQVELAHKASELIREREDQLASIVRSYVTRNNGDPHGKIILPSQKGTSHIEVVARSPYEPLILQDVWARDGKKYIYGEGLSPKRDYLSHMSNRTITY